MEGTFYRCVRFEEGRLKQLGDLHGVERRALEKLIGHQPQIERVGLGHVPADPANHHGIAAGHVDLVSPLSPARITTHQPLRLSTPLTLHLESARRAVARRIPKLRQRIGGKCKYP